MRFLRFTPASVMLAVVFTLLLGWKPFRPSQDIVWLEVPITSDTAGVATLQTWSGAEHWNSTGSQARVDHIRDLIGAAWSIRERNDQ